MPPARIFLLAFVLTGASAESWTADESLSGTITIWDWDGSGNRLPAKDFIRYYPNATQVSSGIGVTCVRGSVLLRGHSGYSLKLFMKIRRSRKSALFGYLLNGNV